MNATKKLDVVGICGSLRRDSLNRKALRAAEELMPPSMTMQVVEIGDLPMYNFDLHQAGFPAPVTRLCASRPPMRCSSLLRNTTDRCRRR